MDDEISGDEPRSSRAHHIRLDEFEGPLDLLIFLIRKSEVSIHDIPIARITEQYLEYLALATDIDLDRLTDFYLMAATLLHIKSRMLLPQREADEGEDWDDPRQELVEKLIEYQRFRKLTELMVAREEETDFSLERRSAQTVLPFEDEDDLWEQIDIWELVTTFSRIMRNVNSEQLIELYEEVTVNEKLTLIEEFIATRGEFPFTDLVRRRDSVMEFVCAFIAILEAARQKAIRILQNRMFGDIRICGAAVVTPAG